MTGRARGPRGDSSGVSAVEVVIALMILSTVLLGIAATTSTAARSLTSGRLDVESSAAIQYQAEALMSLDFDSLKNGSATVQDIPMSWSVSGTDVKSVELVARVTNVFGETFDDTTVVVRADPDR